MSRRLPSTQPSGLDHSVSSVVSTLWNSYSTLMGILYPHPVTFYHKIILFFWTYMLFIISVFTVIIFSKDSQSPWPDSWSMRKTLNQQYSYCISFMIITNCKIYFFDTMSPVHTVSNICQSATNRVLYLSKNSWSLVLENWWLMWLQKVWHPRLSNFPVL